MSIFTYCEANLLSVTLTRFDSDTIICAAVTTLAIFAGLVFVAYQNRHKQYSLPTYMLQLIVADLVISLIMMFFFSFDSVVIAMVQAGISIGYILIDLYMIMNNKQNMITIDDHVYASMIIYADLIRLFIKILQIIEKLSNKKDKKRN